MEKYATVRQQDSHLESKVNTVSLQLTLTNTPALSPHCYFPPLDQEIRKKNDQKIKQPVISDSDICEPQMALEVITFFFFFFLLDRYHCLYQRVERGRGMFLA